MTTLPLLLVTALAIAQGLQLLRGLFASLSVYLGQVRDLDPGLLALITFAVFASSFAAPLLSRRLGRRRALLTLIVLLALLHLGEQLTGRPDARLVIQTIGAAAWLQLIPLIVCRPESKPQLAHPSWPLGALLLGLTVDTAIKGAFWTLDLGFADGTAPLLTSAALAGLALIAAARLARQPAPDDARAAPPIASFAVGPGLALHLLILQNLARHSALTDWSTPAVLAWTLAANLAALLLAVFWTQRGPPPRRVSLLAAAFLTLSAAPWHSPESAAASAMLGPAAIAALWSVALTRQPGPAWGWTAAALGLFAIPVLMFGWYAHYEIDVPIPQWILPIAVAAALPICSRRPSAASTLRLPRPPQLAIIVLAALLLILPLHQFLTHSPPTASQPAGSIRVMTFNIHQGFDLDGRPDLEAIAELIEAQRPDLVALQETPRGWLINGSVDALNWLAQRLAMHSAWGPASDRFWGNAVLSRYPITSIENMPMPNNDAIRLDRAWLLVTIDAPGGPIQVAAAHLHHVEREPQHRLPQVRAILDGVDWSRPTILLGDLNAQPQHQEIQLLLDSGLSASDRPVPTYPAQQPRRQIDYILTTSHFAMDGLRAIRTTASDHLPLIAELSRRPE